MSNDHSVDANQVFDLIDFFGGVIKRKIRLDSWAIPIVYLPRRSLPRPQVFREIRKYCVRREATYGDPEGPRGHAEPNRGVFPFARPRDALAPGGAAL